MASLRGLILMQRYKVKNKLFGHELVEDDQGEVVKFEDAEFESKCQSGTRWTGIPKDRVIEILELRLGNARREINNLNRKINENGN